MSSPENRLSKQEETRLAFEGIFDKVGAAVLGTLIETADKRMQETGHGLDGVYTTVDEAEPGDFFATTVQIDAESVSIVFGGDTEAYTLPRGEVSELIAQRIQEEAANPPSA